MLGTSALSELPLSSGGSTSASTSAAAFANAEATAAGVGAAEVSRAVQAFASVFASGQGAAAVGVTGVGAAAVVARGLGRADAEAGKAGYAGAVSSAFAVGRIEAPAIVAIASTRVLQTLAITVEVLPLVAPARSLVLAQPSAVTTALASTTVATSEPLADTAAASRVER